MRPKYRRLWAFWQVFIVVLLLLWMELAVFLFQALADRECLHQFPDQCVGEWAAQNISPELRPDWAPLAGLLQCAGTLPGSISDGAVWQAI
jgi:hypothetical protein